jgi:cyclase
MRIKTKIFYKSLFLVFVGVMLTMNAFTQKKLIREQARDVYYYYGDESQKKSANCTWIIFNDFVLAIDANYPWGAEEILAEIKKTSNKPVRFVFNTHYHHDHTFGNTQFARQGASVISTAETRREMESLGQKEWDQRSAYSGSDMKNYERTLPNLVFDDSLIFDDGVHRVELIKMGPAHTSGDGVAWLPKERILITGDLFVHGNPWGNNVADAHADYDRWLLVLDTLLKWDAKIIIPGHGEPATNNELQNQREYLADLFSQVRKGIRENKSKEELQQSIDLTRHPAYGANEKSIRRSIGELYDRMTSVR